MGRIEEARPEQKGGHELLSADGPLISVIIAVYNGEKYLQKALESVISQHYTQKELIVIDGNSTDNTVSIIEKFSEDIKYWLSEHDRGIYDAWNKAIEAASGEWICFIGADDFLWDDQVLANVVPYLKKARRQDARYVYGKVVQLTEAGDREIETLGEPWEDCGRRFRQNMAVAHCGSFHHRDLFRLHGLFDPSFKIAGDYEFLLREFKDASQKAVFAHDLPVVGMRSGGVSGNLDQRLVMALEAKLARKKNGVTEFSSDIFFWILRIRAFKIIDTFFGRKFTSRMADSYRSLVKGKRKRWSN